jgi:group II intron reverse transcriptase/maturase
MKHTSLRGIANKASTDKTHRFRNLSGMLTAGFLLWCWQFINRRATPGVDKQTVAEYEEDLKGNIDALVEQVKQKRYRAKLVLRKYIPKLNGKLRALGLAVIADKLLQIAVAKILEAIYEQDFLLCSYGYRPGLGAHDALRELSAILQSGCYHYVVEADIKGFFDNIDHDKLLEMLAQRIDDKPFLNLIRKWLKAGILDTDGQVIHPQTGTPQGGILTPPTILQNYC